MTRVALKMRRATQVNVLSPICKLLLLLSVHYAIGTRRSSSDIPRGTLSSGKCRLLINEINVFPAGSRQFVELKRACQEKPGKINKTSMKNYRIIFFTHDAKLIGTCQPGEKSETEYATKREGSLMFFTIGGEDVAQRDMHFQDCIFASDLDYVRSDQFPVSNMPIAVALLHNQDFKVIEGVELKKDPLMNMPITTHIRYSMEQVILKNLQDLYIVVSSSPYTGCKYFEKYFSGYSIGSNNFLRDWGQLEENNQRSLSRCKVSDLGSAATDWIPFEAQTFYLTKSSPGSHNLCEGGVRFVIEDTQPKRKKPKLHFSPEYECEISTEDPGMDTWGAIANPLTYQSLLNQAIEDAANVPDHSAATDGDTNEASARAFHPTENHGALNSQGEDEDITLNGQDHRIDPQFPTNPSIQLLPETQVSHGQPPTTSAACKVPQPTTTEEFKEFLRKGSPFMWEDCSRFEPKSFVEAIRTDPQSALIKKEYLDDPNVCSWLEWLPSTQKFRCKWCNKLWNQKIIFDNNVHVTKVIKEGQGYTRGSNAKFDNKKMLEKHLNSDLHKISKEYLRLYDSGKRDKQLQQSFETEDGPYRSFLNKTENRFVTVFQAIKLDLPFLKYPVLTELLNHYGVEMGTLYNTRVGMKLISMAISDKLHKDLCNYLRSSRPKMSILIDTSSDVSSTYSLAILFQTFDGNKNIGTVFYRLIQVSTRETTENLYNLLVEALTEDDLLEYVKEKMIGFGTDGGANVKKLKDLLDEVTAHDVIYVYCHAHRLERAVKHAWDGEAILTDADNLVNSLYTTFNSRSPKKKLVIQQQIKDLGDTRFELKPIKHIRWVNSKKRAVETVVRHWMTIIKALQSIQSDKTFPSKQRLSAKLLEERLEDPSMIAALAFVADSTQELAKISLNLQKYGSTLIGKKGTREEIKNGIKSFEDLTGPSIKWLLASAQIKGSNTEGVRLIDFDTQITQLQGIELKLSSVKRIGEILSNYIDSLVREIDISFPTDVTDNFDIFNARTWPEDSLDGFGDAELVELNTGLKWNYSPEELLENWTSLKHKICESEDFKTLREKTPEQFWSSYLQRPTLWTQDLERIITEVLTVPASTAEVERIYSHYTSTKTMRRYNLEVSSVEAIIRIKVNGEKSVEEFSRKAHEYVKDFILRGHLRSDDRLLKRVPSGSSQCVAQDADSQANEPTSVSHLAQETEYDYADHSSESSASSAEYTELNE